MNEYELSYYGLISLLRNVNISSIRMYMMFDNKRNISKEITNVIVLQEMSFYFQVWNECLMGKFQLTAELTMRI